MGFNSPSTPASSGQNVLGTTPFGLNMITRRCLRPAVPAKARLERLPRNGNAATDRPRCFRKSRRVVMGGYSFRWDGRDTTQWHPLI